MKLEPLDPERIAFYRAIAAAPADDLPRLVYCDWLDEHGESAQAAYIRASCELARYDAERNAFRGQHHNGPDRHRQYLSKALMLALGNWYSPWFGFLATNNRNWCRGFITEIRCTSAQFVGGCRNCGGAANRYATACSASCNGSGIAEQLFREQPAIQLVDLTDATRVLIPRHFSMVVRRDPRWPSSGYAVPEEHVLDIFSVAAIAYGRELAGWPAESGKGNA